MGFGALHLNGAIPNFNALSDHVTLHKVTDRHDRIFMCTPLHYINSSIVKLVEFMLEFSWQLLFELLEAVFAGKMLLRDLENIQCGIGSRLLP